MTASFAHYLRNLKWVVETLKPSSNSVLFLDRYLISPIFGRLAPLVAFKIYNASESLHPQFMLVFWSAKFRQGCWSLLFFASIYSSHIGKSWVWVISRTHVPLTPPDANKRSALLYWIDVPKPAQLKTDVIKAPATWTGSRISVLGNLSNSNKCMFLPVPSLALSSPFNLLSNQLAIKNKDHNRIIKDKKRTMANVSPTFRRRTSEQSFQFCLGV